MTVLMAEHVNKAHPVYKALITHPQYQAHRDYIESLWARYEPYADSGFVTEFARRFHERLWEMYLGCALLDMGLRLLPKANRPKGGPDLAVIADTCTIWVEATVANPGDGPDKLLDPWDERVTEMPLNPSVVKKMVLRYRNSIGEKHKKYHNYIKTKIIMPKDSFVIAVNGGCLPWFWRDNPCVPRVIGAVLPVGSPIVTWNTNTDEAWLSGLACRPTVSKENSAIVRTDLFLDDEYRGISAIVGSLVNWTSMRSGALGADFVVVHNPKARNPLPQGWLPRGREFRWDLVGHMLVEDRGGKQA